MRILVTGGFGYLGGRLAQMLGAASDHELTLGTRRTALPPQWAPKSKVVTTDWSNERELARACSGMDAIVHLAGMNAADCAKDPVAALEFNGVGTARLLRAAVEQRVARFIYLSTAHVYGNPLRGSVSEERCAASSHPYATSHRAGEDAVLFAHGQRAIQGIVIRLSNSFGSPAHEQANCWMLLVNDLCCQAVNTRRMVLRSSGLQRRDFITLADVCRAIEHLLNLDSKYLGDGLYNVGGAWAPTIIEMTQRIAECCREIYGYRPEIVRPHPEAGESSAELDYRIGKVLNTGFEIVGDVNSEIIETLKFCASIESPERCAQ